MDDDLDDLDESDLVTTPLGPRAGLGLADAVAAGTGYALYRHGQDRQTATFVEAVRHLEDTVVGARSGSPAGEVSSTFATVRDHVTAEARDWDDYIGQEPLKRQLAVHARAARATGVALPHTLLASRLPGVGKTMVARILVSELGVPAVEVAPPFTWAGVVDVARRLPDRGVLIVDQVHQLTGDRGDRGGEVLLPMLEDKVAHLTDGRVVQLGDLTVIGVTSEPQRLSDRVAERFPLRPHFQPYSELEMAEMVATFTDRHGVLLELSDEILDVCVLSSRGEPRVLEQMVMAAKALLLAEGLEPTEEELLDFMGVTESGFTRQHLQYLVTARRYFHTLDRHGDHCYPVDRAEMRRVLGVSKRELGRIERFLTHYRFLVTTSEGLYLSAAGGDEADFYLRGGARVDHH